MSVAHTKIHPVQPVAYLPTGFPTNLNRRHSTCVPSHIPKLVSLETRHSLLSQRISPGPLHAIPHNEMATPKSSPTHGTPTDYEDFLSGSTKNGMQDPDTLRKLEGDNEKSVKSKKSGIVATIFGKSDKNASEGRSSGRGSSNKSVASRDRSASLRDKYAVDLGEKERNTEMFNTNFWYNGNSEGSGSAKSLEVRKLIEESSEASGPWAGTTDFASVGASFRSVDRSSDFNVPQAGSNGVHTKNKKENQDDRRVSFGSVNSVASFSFSAISEFLAVSNLTPRSAINRINNMIAVHPNKREALLGLRRMIEEHAIKLNKEAEPLMGTFAAEIQELMDSVFTKTTEIANLEAKLADKDKLIGEYDARLDEDDDMIEARDTTILELNKLVAQLQVQVKDL